MTFESVVLTPLTLLTDYIWIKYIFKKLLKDQGDKNKSMDTQRCVNILNVLLDSCKSTRHRSFTRSETMLQNCSLMPSSLK